MVLHQFPDLQWLKAQALSGFVNRRAVDGIRLEKAGWPTVILNTTTKQVVRDNIQGPLSIFTNLSGISNITIDRNRVNVDADTFYISNAGQAYTLEIDQEKPIETFNIHISESLSTNAFQSFFSTTDQLLEESVSCRQFGFHNRIIPITSQFSSIIRDIRDNAKNSLLLDEKLYQLISLLVSEQENVMRMGSRLNVVKPSTRKEIVKRLLTATDYLFMHYIDNPNLEELATISCLSKFHFLRLFKLAYNKTPHQFIVELKIEKAKKLLKASSEVGVIAHQLGFDSTSSFSRTFYQRVGVYPTQFRQASAR